MVESKYFHYQNKELPTPVFPVAESTIRVISAEPPLFQNLYEHFYQT